MSFDTALLNLVGAGLGVVGSRTFAVSDRPVRQSDPADLIGFLTREGCGRQVASLAQEVARSLVGAYRADPDRVVRHIHQSTSLLPDHAFSSDPAVRAAWDTFRQRVQRPQTEQDDAADSDSLAVSRQVADAVLMQPRKVGLMAKAGLDEGLVRDIVAAVLFPVLRKPADLTGFQPLLEKFAEQFARSRQRSASSSRGRATGNRAAPDRLEAVRKIIEKSARGAGVAVAALLTLSQTSISGHEPDEEIRRWCDGKAAELKELDTWLTRPADFDAAVATLRAQAGAAIASGRFDLADRLLSQAEDVDVAAARERVESEGLHMAQASETRVLRGHVDELRGDYQAAADHHAAAMTCLAADDMRGRWRLTMRQAQLLARHADEHRDPQALERAVLLHQTCLHLRPRSSSKDWAATQHMFGRLLLKLSEYQDDPDSLRKAVEACRSAADELFGQREPMRWAQAMADYAIALHTLGERTGDQAALSDALAAQRETLAVFTRVSSPQDWAQAQIGIASTLLLIAARDGSQHRLTEAIAAYRTALDVLDVEQSPDLVVKARIRLAEAHFQAARRDGQSRHAMQAEDVLSDLRAADGTDRVSKTRLPLEWARLQAVRGSVEVELGRRSRSSERLLRAIDMLESALEFLGGTSMVLHLAGVHYDLGAAHEALSHIERFSEPRLAQAVSAYRDAVSALDRAAYPRAWAHASLDLARALHLLGLETTSERWLSESQVVEQAALEVIRTIGDASLVAFVEDSMAERAAQIERLKKNAQVRR